MAKNTVKSITALIESEALKMETMKNYFQNLPDNEGGETADFYTHTYEVLQGILDKIKKEK